MKAKPKKHRPHWLSWAVLSLLLLGSMFGIAAKPALAQTPACPKHPICTREILVQDGVQVVRRQYTYRQADRQITITWKRPLQQAGGQSAKRPPGRA